MEDRYKRFVPHEDNVSEIISSDHVNELQEQVEKNEEELWRQEDDDFLTDTLFVLENHPMINSLYLDLIETPVKVDIPSSTGLAFNTEERSISFDGTGAIEATLIGKSYTNVNNTNIKSIILMANTYCPPETSIIFELSNNGVDFYQVTESNSQVFEFPTTGNKLQIRAKFIRPYNAESPILKSYAVLYRDPKYLLDLNTMSAWDPETPSFLGLHHYELLSIGPDDHHKQKHTHDGKDGSGLISHKVLTDIGEDDHHDKNHHHGKDGVDLVDLATDVAGTIGFESLPYILQTGEAGDLELIRNPLAEDKLVRVIAPDSDTYLFYDWNNQGRLGKVITIFGDLATVETFTYGTYTNSAGKDETVMLGTAKYIKDAVEQEIQDAIALVMAPKPAPTTP